MGCEGQLCNTEIPKDLSLAIRDLSPCDFKWSMAMSPILQANELPLSGREAQYADLRKTIRLSMSCGRVSTVRGVR